MALEGSCETCPHDEIDGQVCCALICGGIIRGRCILAIEDTASHGDVQTILPAEVAATL